MERFVQLIVVGGLALIAGLWVVTLLASRSGPWFVGIALVLLGIGGLAAGVRDEIEV